MVVKQVVKLDNKVFVKTQIRDSELFFVATFNNDRDQNLAKLFTGSEHVADDAMVHRIDLTQRPQNDASFERLLTDDYIQETSDSNNVFIGFCVDSSVMALLRTLFIFADGFPYVKSADTIAALKADERKFCAFLSQAIRTFDATNFDETMGEAQLEHSSKYSKKNKSRFEFHGLNIKDLRIYLDIGKRNEKTLNDLTRKKAPLSI